MCVCVSICVCMCTYSTWQYNEASSTWTQFPNTVIRTLLLFAIVSCRLNVHIVLEHTASNITTLHSTIIFIVHTRLISLVISTNTGLKDKELFLALLKNQ